MSRSIAEIGPNVDPQVMREQELAACNVAYTALEAAEEVPLRWFTREVLKLKGTWTPLVGMALFGKDPSGALGWMVAESPLAWVYVVTERTALKWNPELIFGCNADKVIRPEERAISTLGASRPAERVWRDDPLGYLHYKNVKEYFPDWRSEVDHIDDELCLWPARDGLNYNWDLIGHRAGFDRDWIELMKARCQGYTRSTAHRKLRWPETKIEAVWRRHNRMLGDSKILDRLQLVLRGQIKEPPAEGDFKPDVPVSNIDVLNLWGSESQKTPVRPPVGVIQ